MSIKLYLLQPMFLLEKNCMLRIVLDESVAHLGDRNGSSIVRGEVIVDFSRVTPVQGAIHVVFKGVQIVHPWFELTKQPKGFSKPIETVIHQIEFPILLPTQQDIITQGIQRFPFEFPIPGWLPITIIIPGRLNIFYRVSATLCRSPDKGYRPWMDWSRFTKKNKLSSTVYLRVIRAVDPLSDTMPENRGNDTSSYCQPIPCEGQAQAPGVGADTAEHVFSVGGRAAVDDFYGMTSTRHSANHDRSGLSLSTLGLDEQHDRLVNFMHGRSVDNFCQPLPCNNSPGVRYKLCMAQTAIALGTSLDVQVCMEPIESDIKIRSVSVRALETRAYSIKMPSGRVDGECSARTVSAEDHLSMVLKWGYCTTAEKDNGGPLGSNPMTCNEVRNPKPRVTSKGPNRRSHPDTAQAHISRIRASSSEGQRSLSWDQIYRDNSIHSSSSDGKDSDATGTLACAELVNLKELDMPVNVGERFDGRFKIPVPNCNDMLRPTMSHDTVNITHWFYLDVVIERNKKMYRLTLGSPVRLLDCRLVAHNDEGQIILPPPPDYREANSTFYPVISADIWAQRWSITQSALWGMSSRCPCQLKCLADMAKDTESIKDAPPSFIA